MSALSVISRQSCGEGGMSRSMVRCEPKTGTTHDDGIERLNDVVVALAFLRVRCPIFFMRVPIAGETMRGS